MFVRIIHIAPSFVVTMRLFKRCGKAASNVRVSVSKLAAYAACEEAHRLHASARLCKETGWVER